MAIGRPARDTETDPFYDMLFNMLVLFVFCFVIALMAFNPRANKSGDVPAKAEFMITVSWPDDNPNDVDTWVEGPNGRVVWFRNRDDGLVHLDRDDRGDQNNQIVVNGQTVASPMRQEIVTLRGAVPGEYVVNAHYYESRDKRPVSVRVQFIQINPQARVVFEGDDTLARKGDERTLLRFTLDAQGQVAQVSTTQKTIVARTSP